MFYYLEDNTWLPLNFKIIQGEKYFSHHANEEMERGG